MSRHTKSRIPRRPASSLSHRNHLWLYRKRMGFSQNVVATLLGHASAAHVSEYERGKCLPNLDTALKLEIILRVPVAFLYEERYKTLKHDIRLMEEQLKSHPCDT